MMKKYGIYLAYPPGTNLMINGLGRYLIELLKKAPSRQVFFIIACPSWMRISLLAYFNEANIDPNWYQIIGPSRKPMLLNSYEKYLNFKKRPRFRRKKSDFWAIKIKKLKVEIEKRAVSQRQMTPFFLLGTFFLTLALIFLLIYKFCLKIARRFFGMMKKLFWRGTKNRFLRPLKKIIINPKLSTYALHLYKLMYDSETHLMNQIINSQQEAKAWYCPTAFWPAFNAIKAPRLICVPDVVLKDFAVGFAVLGERYLDSYREIEKTIHEGTHFVTYSEEVKWNTLVEHFHQNAAQIRVIPHGANELQELIKCQNVSDEQSATQIRSHGLLKTAMNKAVNSQNFYKFNQLQSNPSGGFLFYASQFRPNKNIISLLQAYDYLLRQQFMPLKLILTGDPLTLKEIKEFIDTHQLNNEVLCLYGLSEKELAACYHLATLSVNPSFSEGGFPFTFTESLSVDTPVVMARIPVTEEIITCPELQQIMLFDPYDWKDMAHRILWALENKDLLLAKQKIVYQQIAKRTWAQVIDDYINVLDDIAAQDIVH